MGVKRQPENNIATIHQYLVVGRHVPSESNPNPKIYKMRIFSNNGTSAKSKFWYFLRKLNKVKRANGEILSCSEIFERDPTKVKTFGIVCTYKSKFGYHTLYKEYRSLTLNGACDQLYNEMAGRHKAQRESVTIVRTSVLSGNVEETCRRLYTRQIVKDGVRFPVLNRLIRNSDKQYRTVFKAVRPSLFAQKEYVCYN